MQIRADKISEIIRSHEPEGELLSFIGSYRFILLSRVSVNKKGSKDRFIRVPCQLAIIFNLPHPFLKKLSIFLITGLALCKVVTFNENNSIRNAFLLKSSSPM